MRATLAIIAILSIITFNTQAQTEKGNFLLGGSASYSNSKLSTAKGQGFQVAPKIGYFLDKNFAIGIQLIYAYNKNKYSLNSEETFVPINRYEGAKNQAYGISPFARYYVGLNDQFKFFGEFTLFATTGKSRNTDDYNISNVPDYNFKNYGARINPGFAFFPTKKWAVELAFPLLSYSKYTYSKQSLGNAMKNSDAFEFGLTTLSPMLGVNYYF